MRRAAERLLAEKDAKLPQSACNAAPKPSVGLPPPQNNQDVPSISQGVGKKQPLNFGDSLALVGLVLGVLLMVIVPPLIFKVVLLAAICAILLWLSKRSYWTCTLSRKRQNITALVVLVAICGVSIPQFMAQWKSEHPKKLSSPLAVNNGISVLAECRIAGFPIDIQPHDALHLIPLNPKRLQQVKWGLSDIPNDTDKLQKWPPKDKMELAKKLHDPGVFTERCDISNHGQMNLVNVVIPMKFWFGEKGGEANAMKFEVVVSPLDVGAHFVFYTVNDCPTMVSGVLPDTASVRIAGESNWRDIPLNRPFRNPVEQIMMSFPTKVRWIGGEPCQ